MGTYKFKTSPNEMYIEIDGQFSAEEATQYCKDFTDEAKKVNPAQCKLYLQASKMAVSPNETAKVLLDVLTMYKNFGFEKVSINMGTNAVLQMQVRSLASKVNFKEFDVVK